MRGGEWVRKVGDQGMEVQGKLGIQLLRRGKTRIVQYELTYLTIINDLLIEVQHTYTVHNKLMHIL